ncbi:signal peptide peptidase SppA [Shewanella sp. 1_MG-2023]|uniref:signal peptide peptidase SppA n=1 Tax=unclassified Shewanella TaxID=196818 RepID=UPI0026E462E4|nr:MULTISPECIES: signal peptide peptidase SppA [unclassified Shewanella]MDO6612378.1 signal peptide peptidase SppA [Shewanella sp. 7_MG-2023]MDO6772232.1 signal peptide peptidase SppA [Shewanella sp. 2_MG-2023]MDO6794138.1 signal peptide peptidase SppA [Shewanella sp. 1_MG-2023]
MSAKPSLIKRIFTLIWKTINGIRKIILNLIFFGFIAIIIVALSADDEIVVEDQSALVLNLAGSIVDQKRHVDPIEAVFKQSKSNDPEGEVLLSDIIYVINSATQDPRIQIIVLQVGNLRAGGISKMTAIGDALNEFKAAGKSVVAFGNSYEQNQYFIASYADSIYLNNKGAVSLEGLSSYRLFYKSALEKLNVSTHVFRVGTFKSAVEPFIRDDMSAPAKDASSALLTDIWQNYESTVAANRNIDQNDIVLNPQRFLTELDKVSGDSAQLALKMKWVDELVSDEAFRLAMVEKVGQDTEGDSFKQISFSDYHAAVQPIPSLIEKDSVGIIVAKGNILNGKQQAGQIGGESTSALLKKARFDDKVKAVVLRVDSPGGSAFASEKIRQEVIALKEAGKPVVVSMGSLAASGGYWISASADYIYATPTTLTGSIGIFGMFATFENVLSNWGINSDGVSTSEWAGISATRALDPNVSAVIQRHVEHGYHEFISLVAKERDMTLEQVDRIAQGRVWSGTRAVELGLVDELGDIDSAVAKAATLAEIEKFDTKVIQQELTTEEIFVQKMLASASAYLPQASTQSPILEQLFSQWISVVEEFSMFEDPNGMYLYCENCNY